MQESFPGVVDIVLTARHFRWLAFLGGAGSYRRMRPMVFSGRSDDEPAERVSLPAP